MATTLTKLRHQAFADQQGRCFYCGFPMWERNGKTFALQHGVPKSKARHLRCTAEHLMARQNAGKDVRENIVAACCWCNQARHRSPKSAPDPQTWRREVRARLASHAWHPAARELLPGRPRAPTRAPAAGAGGG